MAIYQSTIDFRCWKEHTCVGCDGSFAYQFSRRVFGRGPTEQVATVVAHAAVARAANEEADEQPCPSCGLYQPNVAARRRIGWHWGVFAACVGGWLFMLVLHVTGAAEADVTVWVTAGVLALAAFLHLLTGLRNPNRHLLTNRQLALRRVDEGVLRIVKPGETEPSAEARAPRWSWGRRLAYASLVLAALCTPAAEVLRAALGWPYNVGYSPPVAGPGDETEIFLPTQIECVKGHWRAEPEVVARDADDPHFRPVELEASSSNADWGQKISAKPSEKGMRRWPWVRVRLPQSPDLEGKTLKLKIRLRVTHPKATGKGFENVQQTLDANAELDVAPPRAGVRYTWAWWVGMLGGGAIGLLAGAYLIAEAHADKRKVPTTKTYPIEEAPVG